MRLKMLDFHGLVLTTPVLHAMDEADRRVAVVEPEGAVLRRQLANVESTLRGMASIPGSSADSVGAYGFAAELVGGILRPAPEDK